MNFLTNTKKKKQYEITVTINSFNGNSTEASNSQHILSILKSKQEKFSTVDINQELVFESEKSRK